MVVMAGPEVFNQAFIPIGSETGKTVLDVIYNPNVQFCLNRNLLNEYDALIEDKDLFHALIVNLNDDDRIHDEATTEGLGIAKQLNEVAAKINSKIWFALSLNGKCELAETINGCINLQERNELTKEWLAINLLTKSFCSVDFSHFKNNKEIENFFLNVVTLPKRINRVDIFNRELSYRLLVGLKSKFINYYTICRKPPYGIEDLKNGRAELKEHLGGKVHVHFTFKKSQIHERKVIIDDLIITFDNSLENILVQEPTWDVTISFDSEKSGYWTAKCSSFKKLH